MNSLLLGRDAVEGDDFTLDPDAPCHIAIQGQTRSGKSMLTYVVLSQLSRRPDVVVAGLDPTGIVLAPFQDGPMPELRAGGLDPISRYVEALRNLVAMMEKRIGELLEAGSDGLTRFSPSSPMVFVVLEEWPGIMAAAKADDQATGRKPAERLASRIELLTGRLLREGAKVGFRVLMIVQRFSSASIDTDARAQFATRISLRLDNADAVRMLHDSVDEALIAAFPKFAPGEGLCDLPGERIHFYSYSLDYREYLRRVRRNLSGQPGRA